MLATATLLFALATPRPTASPDPYAVYKTAMQHLAILPQPSYIVDTERWLAVSAGGNSEWDERTVFDSTSRRECVLNVPYTTSRLPEIGESYFAPDTWLVIHRQIAPPAGSANMVPDLSDRKTIANVISVAKPSYDIRRMGIDSLTRGGAAFHLSLHPRLDPRKHNLRELWINTQTDNIMRAIIEGEYRPTYMQIPVATFVSEDFSDVAGYWLVLHHVWTYREPVSAQTFQYNATSLTMQFPASLPDWFFDTKQFPKHYAEVTSLVGP